MADFSAVQNDTIVSDSQEFGPTAIVRECEVTKEVAGEMKKTTFRYPDMCGMKTAQIHETLKHVYGAEIDPQAKLSLLLSRQVKTDRRNDAANSLKPGAGNSSVRKAEKRGKEDPAFQKILDAAIAKAFEDAGQPAPKQ